METKTTVFNVNEELCTGCGICVDSCPMKILEIEDGLCILTDAMKCLECGTCMRDCPNEAIFIPNVKMPPKEKSSDESKKTGETNGPLSQEYTQVLPALMKIVQEINPVQVNKHGNIDITGLNKFELEGHLCYYREFKADKLEKIGLSSMDFYGAMTADVLSITPGPEYDIPYYIMDWDESESHIFFICDLMPSDDLSRNLDHLQNYFYEPLEDLYQEFIEVPGMKPSVFHWVRAIHSPYIVTGTIDKAHPKHVDMIYRCAEEYLKVWLDLYKNAKPRDPDSAYMKYIHERRLKMRELYKEYDPGVGTLNKFLSDDMADVALSIIEP